MEEKPNKVSLKKNAIQTIILTALIVFNFSVCYLYLEKYYFMLGDKYYHIFHEFTGYVFLLPPCILLLVTHPIVLWCVKD